MARRGFRTIVVGEHRLRWRFAPGAVDSVVTVVGRGGRLTVTLYGWRDPWMALSGVVVVGDTLTLTTAAVNDPPVIGPGFVQAAVVQALARGWDPQARGAAMALAHAAGGFIDELPDGPRR